MSKIKYWQLKQRQSLPLEVKIKRSQLRIKEFYEKMGGKVYVSFSGGKDSTVLLHMVRNIYPDIPAVFSNTGLEYPEIVDFIKTINNVIIVKPKITFKEVIEIYGYPVISKKISRFVKDLQNPKKTNKNIRRLRLTGITSEGKFAPSYQLSKKWVYLVDAPFKISDSCCDYLKKRPLDNYAKETQSYSINATMACESKRREQQYLNQGCNAFNLKNPMSQPMGFWLEEDVWSYIKKFKIPYSKIYDMGEKRTGCIFCMFGVHMEKEPNRFQRMQYFHPALYNYCINQLKLKNVLSFLKVPYKNEEIKCLK